MNIFETEKGFFGDYKKGELKESTSKFWHEAREIRKELGEDGYLLDAYLSEVFNVLDEVIITNIVNEVDEMMNKLYFLCKNIAEYKSVKNQDEFYKLAYDYITSHHLPNKEIETRLKLYIISLVDEFTDIFIEKIYDKINTNFISKSKADVLKGNFERISKKVGETKMENLNILIKKKFALPEIFEIYKRAVNRNLLYYLQAKDAETSKQNFQLILESSTLL